jgi:hypothetical protein
MSMLPELRRLLSSQVQLISGVISSSSGNRTAGQMIFLLGSFSNSSMQSGCGANAKEDVAMVLVVMAAVVPCLARVRQLATVTCHCNCHCHLPI